MFKKHKPKFYVNKILSSNLKVNESVSENDLNNNEIRIESSDFNEREALPENSSSKKIIWLIKTVNLIRLR